MSSRGQDGIRLRADGCRVGEFIVGYSGSQYVPVPSSASLERGQGSMARLPTRGVRLRLGLGLGSVAKVLGG